MNLTDIVFVPTVQHTGTWFVLRFLERFIPKIEAACSIVRERTPPFILHTHFPLIENRAWQFFAEEHYDNMSIEGIWLFSSFLKTVIPVRDPLAALLSREARRPELRHFYIVEGFKQMARLEGHKNIKFFPIDLYEASAERDQLLSDTLSHCGIDPVLHQDEIAVMAIEWIPENVTPDNRFKELYANKDIENIHLLLGVKWEEVEYLKGSTDIIFPFLNRLGYERRHLDLWL